MDWIKGFQAVVPWLAALPLIPKLIVSALIIGVAAFILTLIWLPPPETAVSAILHDCHRRALFTRMHAQVDTDKMFVSIGKCRETLQQQVAAIHSQKLQDAAMELLAVVEQIERRNPIHGYDNLQAINKLKLAALHSFRELASATGGRYPLPGQGKLAEAVYFTQEEADAPLSLADLRNQHAIDEKTGEIAPG